MLLLMLAFTLTLALILTLILALILILRLRRIHTAAQCAALLHIALGRRAPQRESERQQARAIRGGKEAIRQRDVESQCGDAARPRVQRVVLRVGWKVEKNKTE